MKKLWPRRSPPEPFPVESSGCLLKLSQTPCLLLSDHGLHHHVCDLGHESWGGRRPTMPRTDSAHLVADLRPNPPILIGKVANSLANALSASVPGVCSRRVSHCLPHAVVVRSRTLCSRAWWHGAQTVVGPGVCTLHQELPRALQVRHSWNGLPESTLLLDSVIHLLRHELWGADGCSQDFQALWLPSFWPQLLHVLCGALPALFHTLVFP